MSTTEVGLVHVSTVAFRFASTAPVDVGSPAAVNSVTAASLDAGGLLTYYPHLVSGITLASGTVLRGIRALHSNGDPYVSADEPELLRPMLLLRAEDGGSFTVSNEDGSIAEPSERLTTAYGLNATIGPDAVQVFWSLLGADRRWRCPHWGVYVPGNPAAWTAPAPTTVSEALDRLVAAYNAAHPGAEP